MKQLTRRITLARELWIASKGRRREVGVYRTYGAYEPLARGPLRSMGAFAVQIGSTRVPWSRIARVAAWPEARCQNCLREHGPRDECLVAVLAGVVVEREEREITPELLARVHVDELWDLYGGPAVDWLEDHLSWLEAENAM